MGHGIDPACHVALFAVLLVDTRGNCLTARHVTLVPVKQATRRAHAVLCTGAFRALGVLLHVFSVLRDLLQELPAAGCSRSCRIYWILTMWI